MVCVNKMAKSIIYVLRKSFYPFIKYDYGYHIEIILQSLCNIQYINTNVTFPILIRFLMMVHFVVKLLKSKLRNGERKY